MKQVSDDSFTVTFSEFFRVAQYAIDYEKDIHHELHGVTTEWSPANERLLDTILGVNSGKYDSSKIAVLNVILLINDHNPSILSYMADSGIDLGNVNNKNPIICEVDKTIEFKYKEREVQL